MLILRELRKKRGLSMKQLADIIGMAESTISLYENEKRQPDYETLIKMADYFDVSLDDMFGREFPKGNKNIGNITNLNHHIAGNVDNSVSVNRQNNNMLNMEQDLYNIFHNADGKTQVKIMQFMYGLENETEE